MLVRVSASLFALLLTPFILEAHAEKDKPYHGKWLIVSSEYKTKDMPVSEEVWWVIDGEKFQVLDKKKTLESGTFKIDKSKSPVQIDLFFPERDKTEAGYPGIIKLEEDKITVCYDRAGEERPEAFATSKKKQHVLIALQKVK